MIRSMTGFGAADGPVGGSRVSVELRSVNHRFFNPNLKLPTTLSHWEGEVREALRQRIARGHVTAYARIERPEGPSAVVDEAKFAEYATELRRLQEVNGLAGEVDVATILRMPDVLRVGHEDDGVKDGTASELVAVVDAAATALLAMRGLEGARLKSVIVERLELVNGALTRLAARAPARLEAQRVRLRENVEKLAGGIAVDPQRLAQEIAILADRLDVGEEIDRFHSHIVAFRAALDSKDDDPVGKRLGFLLQEMLREANTTGSKANDAEMLRDVVAIKEELERIREQVENLE